MREVLRSWTGECRSMRIFYEELHRDVLHLLIVAGEAAKQGVTVGKCTVSGLMFADDFVGTSETPEGLKVPQLRALLTLL